MHTHITEENVSNLQSIVSPLFMTFTLGTFTDTNRPLGTGTWSQRLDRVYECECLFFPVWWQGSSPWGIRTCLLSPRESCPAAPRDWESQLHTGLSAPGLGDGCMPLQPRHWATLAHRGLSEPREERCCFCSCYL